MTWPVRPPAITAKGTNNFLRLTGGTAGNVTSVTYDINDGQLGFGANFGAYNLVVAEFDFRITGQADGFGFILFDTTAYGQKDIVPRAGFAGAQMYQEPTATNSLGIGFDTHQGTEGRTELNDNHLSPHFNNERLLEVDAGSIDLNGEGWIHAQITLQYTNTQSELTVVLTPQIGGAVSSTELTTSVTDAGGALITNRFYRGRHVPQHRQPAWVIDRIGTAHRQAVCATKEVAVLPVRL
ncbi:MAG: hypothetical protein CMO80_02555 [Verrucomicrobiales bacterium]|nr:hypothetical protein [Verrucomicrobiales bacterium]